MTTTTRFLPAQRLCEAQRALLGVEEGSPSRIRNFGELTGDAVNIELAAGRIRLHLRRNVRERELCGKFARKLISRRD